MKFRISVALLLLWAAGCATPFKLNLNKARSTARIIHTPIGAWEPVSAGTNAEIAVSSGLQNVLAMEKHLARLQGESDALRTNLQGNAWHYFTVDETEQIEGLLFRYLACRETLWDIIAYYGNRDRPMGDEELQAKALIIALNAAVLLSDYSSRLVLTFLDEPAMIRKLNERHNVYDISGGTYDMLFASVTSGKNRRALMDAWVFVSKELANEQSAMARVRARVPAYRDLLDKTAAMYESVKKTQDILLKKNCLFFPNFRNALRHSRAVRRAKRLVNRVSDNLYEAKGRLFNAVSDIKRRSAKPAVFTAEQVERIHQLLEPGDVIFTYTAGYMSNVFLPGLCKHGILHVGSPADRAAAGATAEQVVSTTEEKRRKLEKILATETLRSGYKADVVEAVAEGVIFNSLDALLKNHINRMVVLRPRLTAEERRDALLTVFRMVGGQYDFNFDFANVTYLCCTEVAYRALQKRGGIEFSLTPRFGIQTLSADDIMRYHLKQIEPKFDTILMAEEAPHGRKHAARVLEGADAENRLRELMKIPVPAAPANKER